MADDADTAGGVTGTTDVPAATHARTDRQSVETAPESLYLWQIAVLEARVEHLQRSVEMKEQDLQRVIDRYEGVLDERRARDGERRTDGGNSVSGDGGPSRGRESALGRGLDRLRSLVE